MNEGFLGDSYDMVKRFWWEQLRPIAPLYAHHRFVPVPIRDRYVSLTGIPILAPDQPAPFGILLDPHTGIPLPSEAPRRVSLAHAPLDFLVALSAERSPNYLICFDQAHDRREGAAPREAQWAAKVDYLRRAGLAAFYYVSHSPFLFAAPDPRVLRDIRGRLTAVGIPGKRFRP